MGFLNILSTKLPSFGNLGEVALKHEWICKIIGALINFVGDVGIGIILFTLILKLITLPLDIYSRASTKKNSLKMEMMKDDLEKLQKQYKNNERLYQQKMMALYKKNGYSAFSACLPTLVTLIFFIIVIGAFNNYSRFADKEVFNQMGVAYDSCLDGFADKNVLQKGEGSNAYSLNLNKAIEEKNYEAYFNGYSAENIETETNKFQLNVDLFASADSKILKDYPKYSAYVSNGELNKSNSVLQHEMNTACYNYVIEKLGVDVATDNPTFIKLEADGVSYNITDLGAFCLAYDTEYKYIKVLEDGSYAIKYEELFSGDLKDLFEEKSSKLICDVILSDIGKEYLDTIVKPAARAASANAYENRASKSVIFPWVKNLWVVDSPFKYALPERSELETSLGAENMGDLTQAVYDELTYNLKGKYQQKGFGKGNGLFILVALSILTMLGSTVIMNKQQKTQMQLSSVDGENSQAAATQKMMTWMMPIMFGVFAFIYSAAFSIYMITSSLLSTGFTLLINFFVEKGFKKQIEKIEQEKASKIKYGKRR